MNTAQTRISEMEGYLQHETTPPMEEHDAILEKMDEEMEWVSRLTRAYALLAVITEVDENFMASLLAPSRKRQREE